MKQSTTLVAGSFGDTLNSLLAALFGVLVHHWQGKRHADTARVCIVIFFHVCIFNIWGWEPKAKDVFQVCLDGMLMCPLLTKE